MIVSFMIRELWRRALQHGPWFDASTLDIGNTVPLVQSRGQRAILSHWRSGSRTLASFLAMRVACVG